MLIEIQTEEFRQRIKSDLLTIRAALSGDVGAIVELDQTRVGRLSRMDALQQQAMATNMQDRLMLVRRRLEAALARIDADEFGVCCQCREAIAVARLEADPGAPFCTACQDEIDERRKPPK